MPENIRFWYFPTQQLLSTFTQNHLRCLDNDRLSFTGCLSWLEFPVKQTLRWSLACRCLLGVCFCNKHLWKGEEGSRGGQRRKSPAGQAHGGLNRPRGLWSRAGSSDYATLCQHGQIFTALHWFYFVFVIFYLQLDKQSHRAVVTCPILKEIGSGLKPRHNILCHVTWWAGSWDAWIKGNLCGTEQYLPQSASISHFIHSFTP